MSYEKSEACEKQEEISSYRQQYPLEALRKTTGRLLGVDFGDKRTGIALCDPSRLFATGLSTLSVGGIEKTADAVAAEALRQQAVGIVVGLPVNMDGSEGPRARRAAKFAWLLSSRTDLPIALFDERMSTMNASRFLDETNTRGAKRKAVIDTLSAEIILQNALDRLKYL